MRPEEFEQKFSVPRETMVRLRQYEALLRKWQKAINLVSNSTLDDVWNRHFADSAQLSELIPSKARVADLGSGAGFPGMVLAIMRLDLQIGLIESDDRKHQFLRTVSRETPVEVDIHHARVADILPALKPDVITARAFAPVEDILDDARPVLAQNPELKLVLLKGKKAEAELAQAEKSYEFQSERIPSLSEKGASIVMLSEVRPRQ